MDWLASDFPELRLLSVDYNTCISNWGTDCPQHEERDTLSAKAKNVINKLVLADVGRKPIIWVAHSMGGLIVKQILVHAAASLEEDKKSIIENTIGVIFFSVPHRGSELANIFQSAALVFQPSVDISQLRKGCPNLLSLHEKFKDIVSRNGVSVLSFAESKKTRWGLTLTMLVEEDSSNPGFGEYYVLPVDHLNTCKPETRDSFTYTKILQFFQTNIPTHVSVTSSVLREVVELSNVMGLIP